MGNDIAANFSAVEQSGYHQVDDGLSASRLPISQIRLVELESLVGNLYQAKNVIIRAEPGVQSAFREEQQ